MCCRTRVSRRARVLELVESKGLDAVVVLSQSNVFYLTSSDAPSAAILFRDGRLVALAPRLEYLRALEEVGEGEVYAYAKFFEPSEYEKVVPGDLYDALASLLRQEDARSTGVVGASLEAKQKLAEKLGGELADITKEFTMLRRSKDQEELRLMKRAVAIAEEAMRVAVDSPRTRCDGGGGSSTSTVGDCPTGSLAVLHPHHSVRRALGAPPREAVVEGAEGWRPREAGPRREGRRLLLRHH
uniref:Creatinase N-terminal domain-containing protein n=1 Tax=Thermofilum pendens TaxID=2269 RepID=A0A7C3WTK7_THEPE